MTDLSLTQQRSITDAYLRMCESANDTAYETAVREYVELLRKQNADYERYETLQSEISQKFNEPFIKVGLGNVDRFGNKEFSDLHRRLKGIGSNEMDRYVNTYGDRIEFDALYLDAVERKDLETCKRMVADCAARAMPNTKAVGDDGRPRVYGHSTDYDFTKFSTPIAYFSKETRPSEDYGEKVILLYANIEHPIELEDDCYPILNGKRISGYSTMGREEDIDMATLNYDGEAIAEFVKQGYDGMLAGKQFYNCAFHPNTQLKSAEPVTYDDSGRVILLTNRFDFSIPDIRY